MAKRFTDTDLWQKEWFQLLSLKEKVLVKFLFENCDNAGVWEVNFRLASFIIGETITLKDIKTINEKKSLFVFLHENKYIFISKFIEFQYGQLSENCKPHIPVINRLKKLEIFERVSKGFPKGFQTLEEKEKEKEKDKEKEQLKEEEKKENQVKEKKENVKPINEEMRKRLEEMLREQNKRQEEYIESG